jgi:Queuosine biosynthesis protein
VVLHTGLSSYLDDALDARHSASEEEYLVSEAAAAKVNRARSAGRPMIAVGTTVVRALESAVGAGGRVRPGHGYTRLHVTADHALRAVDGLLTGLHEPEASHLDLLAAFLPAAKTRDEPAEVRFPLRCWYTLDRCVVTTNGGELRSLLLFLSFRLKQRRGLFSAPPARILGASLGTLSAGRAVRGPPSAR